MRVALSRPWLRKSRHIRLLGRSDSVAAYRDGDEAVSPAVLVRGADVDGEAVRLLGEPGRIWGREMAAAAACSEL